MAEMVMKDLVQKAGREKEFYIDSAACHRDEIGNGMHRGTRAKLTQMGVPFTDHRARLVADGDYNKFDFIICMDSANFRDLNYKFSGDGDNKVHKLLEFTGETGDVADPWYTGDFDATWNDVLRGCKALLEKLTK